MLNSIIPGSKNYILCYYVNRTHQIQMARIANLPKCKFEKVVFPQQRLMFEALPDAILEVHTFRNNKLILSNQIGCKFLSVQEEITYNPLTSDIA